MIEAEPMGSEAASKHLNRKVAPKSTGTTHNAESGSHPGYLVRYPDGYESWSPRIQFEEAYRPTSGMSFGLAIEAMKRGHRVARKGWNGKGMYVWLCDENGPWTNSEGKTFARQPYLYMKTAQDMVVPWVAAQSDVLGDDWVVIS